MLRRVGREALKGQWSIRVRAYVAIAMQRGDGPKPPHISRKQYWHPGNQRYQRNPFYRPSKDGDPLSQKLPRLTRRLDMQQRRSLTSHNGPAARSADASLQARLSPHDPADRGKVKAGSGRCRLCARDDPSAGFRMSGGWSSCSLPSAGSVRV